MSINSLTVQGNLAADARFNKVSDSRFAVSFTVIVNKSVPDSTSETGFRDVTTPYQCTRFLEKEESAAKLAGHLSKGRQVTATGPFRQAKKNKSESTGKTYHGWQVIADEVVLGAKPKPKTENAAA